MEYDYQLDTYLQESKLRGCKPIQVNVRPLTMSQTDII